MEPSFKLSLYLQSSRESLYCKGTGIHVYSVLHGSVVSCIPHLHLVELSFQHTELSDVTQGILLIQYCVMFIKQI